MNRCFSAVKRVIEQALSLAHHLFLNSFRFQAVVKQHLCNTWPRQQVRLFETALYTVAERTSSNEVCLYRVGCTAEETVGPSIVVRHRNL